MNKTHQHLLLGIAALLLCGIGQPVSAQDDMEPVRQGEERAARADDEEPAAILGLDATSPPDAEKSVRFNFQGVPLDTVLDYLSEAAGFVVVRSIPVSGTISVTSHQPLTPDEAVTVLNHVLYEKGYAAIRNERTLTIVSRDDAKTKNIPVRRGANPEEIPSTSEMVTQIIPIRHVVAADLVDDLRALIPSYATISANESSNSVVLTDTQINVKRFTEIVRALDDSISEISSLRVFPLRYADAKETADLINEIFEEQAAQSSRDRGGRFPGFRGWGDRGDDNDRRSNGNGENPALQASARVIAAADERTNSLLITASDSLMPTVENLVASIDKSTQILTEVRVFPLRNSNAAEMAEVIEEIFSESGSSQNQNQRQRFFGRRGGPPAPQGGEEDQSARQEETDTVLVVADERTNSIVVSAVSDVMIQVASVVEELDRNPARTKQVFVYELENADPEEVSTMLQGMFGGGNRSTTNRNRTNNTTNRNNNSRTGGGQGGGSRN